MACECTWESFVATVAGFFGVDAAKITKETNIYNDLDLDSLGLFSLGMTLHKEYSITVPISVVSSITTIGEMYSSMVNHHPSGNTAAQ